MCVERAGDAVRVWVWVYVLSERAARWAWSVGGGFGVGVGGQGTVRGWAVGHSTGLGRIPKNCCSHTLLGRRRFRCVWVAAACVLCLFICAVRVVIVCVCLRMWQTDIKRHQFFSTLDFPALYRKEVPVSRKRA